MDWNTIEAHVSELRQFVDLLERAVERRDSREAVLTEAKGIAREAMDLVDTINAKSPKGVA